jgi:hypothetical protein
MADRNEYHGYPESLYRIPLDGFLRPSSHLGLSFAFLVVRRISFFVFAMRESETGRADVCCTTKPADAHFMDVLCSCTELVAEGSTGIENRNGGIMIAKAERKEAARQFKERKPSPGIYALRCSTTGRTWVDSSPNLDAAQNSQFFQLRQRLHRNKELQAEWNAHGEASFSFEVLEKLSDDTPSLNLRDLLAERKQAWAKQA